MSEPFQVVAERYARDLWRFCASEVGVERADDCFQETMLSALKAYPQLRDPRVVKAWLFQIAARKTIDVHRAAASAPLPQAEVEIVGEALPAEVGSSEMWEAVRTLPEKQRLAISYRFAVDLSYREISSVMEVSEAAARRNVHEGLARLRERFGDLSISQNRGDLRLMGDKDE